ncbi:MAG: hypothetical protein ACU85V_07565 [Gammaproteobacteria bacterium]
MSIAGDNPVLNPASKAAPRPRLDSAPALRVVTTPTAAPVQRVLALAAPWRTLRAGNSESARLDAAECLLGSDLECDERDEVFTHLKDLMMSVSPFVAVRACGLALGLGQRYLRFDNAARVAALALADSAPAGLARRVRGMLEDYRFGAAR